MRVAILDDYQGVALELADWSPVAARAEISVFRDHLAEPDAVVERLAPFDVVCVMRERTPLPRSILERLPRLRLIASTRRRNASIDTAAATELGIAVVTTGASSSSTVELTWALLLASARSLVEEAAAVRSGGWRRTVGTGLRGKTLGVLGLGNIGGEVARIAQAFGMHVIAWSQNLTTEAAAAAGAARVDKEALFGQADFLTIHLVLSARSRGLVDAAMLALMKPTAHLVNTSRGPIVDAAALLDALRAGRIAGAAVDVFDSEPLPADHPFRTQERLLATPHIGYVSQEVYRSFYGETVSNIAAWMAQRAASGR
ncbi:D-2-hydroxyacid dehydrogenase family protein [Chelatococcus reniformis]|uniref:2-hydroxyacid dehydrogenase n=1 Tax=Chelatococcus reniformis TaxID=1494448 RepID=A0A916U026_9HYPH|nr:D-2-hydroxyacid dehydrogenase family protein [Chelatococcus reniformis]GGC52926.1 2-hydroxyacid dehydrogenase [Chelatococcus reniformis]